MPKHTYQTAERALWSKLKPAARKMRGEPTRAEDRLWRHLRRKGVGAAFRRQHQVGRFIVDFMCLSARLAVEVDGPVHDEADQRSRDVARNAALAAAGFTVLRYTNDQVLEDLDAVVADIQRHLVR